jgi:hypothetical protein
MNKRLLRLTGGFAMICALAVPAFAQDPSPQNPQNPAQPTQPTQQPQTQQPSQPTQQTQTTTTTQTTKAVQNPDGSWTVVEYPADKEVTVSFAPGANLSSAQGRAKVMRTGEQTTINLDLSGVPATTSSLNLYAVDPMGMVTMLGPVNITSGAATQTFTTPLSKFMLVLSPEGNLTTITPGTNVAFRSTVPQGFAVVPMSSSGDRGNAAVGERVSAAAAPAPASAYSAPMLGIPTWRHGTDTHMKVNFAGEMTGSRANVFIEPRKDGATTIKMRFHELKDAPGGKRYVVWAVAPDNSFHKLGQVVNTGQRNEAQLQTETDLKDFGLFITTEDTTDVTQPKGAVVGTVVIDTTK